MNRIYSLPPVIDDNCDRIVLGSMPGRESLQAQRYYGNRHNHFWKIVYGLYGRTPDDNYEERIEFLLSKGIGLWDVIHDCERDGSLDSSIRKPNVNDFAAILERYPAIRALYFNGAKAYELFVRLAAPHLPLAGISLHKLPSTSPAHAIGLENKQRAWERLADTDLEYVE